jgi:Xaa-Pro aminopeptidase
MFQVFDDHQYSSTSADRVARVRDELARQALDGFIVPRADEHQGEDVAAYAERLKWLTGFGGSAGIAIVMRTQGAIFVDGRYTIQVREQVDTNLFEPQHLIETPLIKWIEEHVRAGQRIGFDSWLHTVNEVKKLTKACERARAELVPVTSNPIDAAWADQPSLPRHNVIIHQIQYAGVHARSKLAALAEELSRTRADATVLTSPPSIAWAFNLRGSDIPHTPAFLGFAILHASEKADLFVAPEKLDETVRDYLEDLAVLHEPSELLNVLRRLGNTHKTVLIDPAWASQSIAQTLTQSGAKLVHGADVCLLPKARKNETEIEGARVAHERDAVAVCRFLCWFDREAPKGRLDEIKAAKELELFRTETGKLRDISFPTISAFGPNAAICHYRVGEASNLKITGDGTYLVDSGAQYFDGTTDITRTVAVGKPSDEMKERFTRVLKGHIAIDTARMPKGTSGAQIDVLARMHLWDVGLDFDHGTGHGVGSYLAVHEGPQRISKLGHTTLEPGMIVSNEPGYYKEGEYGIRIENLLLVREPEQLPGEEREMLSFETLTWAPIDLKLVDASMLTVKEQDWLDDYHGQVWETVGQRLREKDRAWLKKATRALNPKRRKKSGFSFKRS